MSYHYSATGERIEDDDRQVFRTEHLPSVTITSRIPDAVVVARCNELRQILRDARARREIAS